MGLRAQRGEESAIPGLATSLRRFAATLLAMLHSRAELLTLELERERLRVTRLVLLAVAAVFFLLLGALTATFFIIALYWDSHRLLASGFLAALYALIGIAIALYARREAARSPRLFSSTVAELKKDRSHFSGD